MNIGICYRKEIHLLETKKTALVSLTRGFGNPDVTEIISFLYKGKHKDPEKKLSSAYFLGSSLTATSA